MEIIGASILASVITTKILATLAIWKKTVQFPFQGFM